jgi:uncharacterized protein (TIGR03000 family)
MIKHSRWMLLAMAGVLLSTADADAFGRRRRGGCNGGGCHGGGYGGCHGGRVISNGCHGGGHGGCHGGRVIHGGCHGGCSGGGVVYGGQPLHYGAGVPRESNYEQGGERLPQPRREGRDDFNENGSETGQIYFRAPQGAEIWVDGQRVERRGDNWIWTSPSLTGRRSFEVRARWNEDGRVVNRTRNVNIQSGGRTTLDFNRPEGSEILPASGESDRNNQGNQRPGASDLDRDNPSQPRSNTTPNTTPRPRDTNPQTQPRPGANDVEPRNPATPRNNTPTTPNTQPRPEDR